MEEINILSTILELGVPGILSIITWKLWTELKEQIAYNRDQDKMNLEQSQKLLTLLDRIYDKQASGDSITHDLIKEMKSELTNKITELSLHIQNSKS